MELAFSILKATVVLVGLVSAGLLVVAVIYNIKRFIAHKQGIESGDIAVPDITPKAQVKKFNLDEIHIELGICNELQTTETKKVLEQDLNYIDKTVKGKKCIPPKYIFNEDHIRLEFDPDLPTPKMDYLQMIAGEYSKWLSDNTDIPVKRVFPEAGELPWIILFRFMTDEILNDLEMKGLLQKAGLTTVDPFGKVLYPIVKFEGDDVLFDCAEVPVNAETFNKACPLFSAKFNKNYQTVDKEGPHKFRMPHIRPRPMVFKPDLVSPKVKGAILPNLDKAELVRNKLLQLKKETGVRWVFLGEVIDPVVNVSSTFYHSLGNDGGGGIFAPIDTFIHAIIAGQTGSGKSSTWVSFAYFNGLLDSDDIMIIADGAKDAADFTALIKYRSNFPAIVKTPEHSNSMIYFGNAFDWVWKEYLRRKTEIRKAKERGVKNIFEYREKVGPMPWVWIFIDEFKGFVDEVGISDDKNATEGGGMGFRLMKLLAEARSYGFTIVLASQGLQTDTYPTLIKRNLPSRLVHAVNTNDQQYEFGEPLKVPLTTGEYLLEVNGVNCLRTGSKRIRCRMPYVGNSDTIEQLFKLEFKNERAKEPIDYDMLFAVGELNFDKQDTVENWAYIKKLFIKEQGFEIKEQLIADDRIKAVDLCAILEDKNKDEQFTIGFGMLEDKTEINEQIFRRNKHIVSKYNCNLFIFFLDFEMGREANAVIDWKQEGVIPFNWIFIPKSLYLKPLQKAFYDYEDGVPNTWFRELVADLSTDFNPDQTINNIEVVNRDVAQIESNRKISTPLDSTPAPSTEEKIKEYQQKSEELDKIIKEKLMKWKESKAKLSEVKAMEAIEPELMKDEKASAFKREDGDNS
jgi:hypothetical protein